ncbi:MAG TPA: Rieske 2Fe-2S domain-containing protein [Acidimicrobiales bacterium]|nr:Rieske 2Fe-2S domain-containing protein [Acidimicrobiales bacterium]
MTDDGLVRALPSDECPLGTPQEPELRLVRVGDQEVMLVRLEDGTVAGVASHCPHQGTELADASFFDGLLRCPRHLYLYDPRTGENVVPARDARPENLWKLAPGYLPTYRVEERDGWIWVAPLPSPPPPGYDPERERRPLASGWRRADAPEPPPEPAPPAAGPVEHPTKTVRVRPGATFELRLPVPGLPGHVWRVEVTGSAGPGGDAAREAATSPLKVLSEQYEPGPPARHRIRLATRAEGVATVRCAYARPWDTEPAEVRAYVVQVVRTGGG